ncbi:serine/threonine protein kinase [Pseudonocardia sp. DSM 110487]|uniref:serine/threonine-protein kinase n=1 Tax=Pseudonocardia sp. DSM 110487 TaxID=2865833 RepID=UPI001C69A4EB|nr:serine/threonine-protein kinase [Pseudonocardia sp. DSM 110487]QYN33262.1 serine/threonine protein kinase [Pseudonocardia sp. DSM 110487]
MTGIPDGAPIAVVAGRYRLRELVGTGGMGAVWRASDELLGREVALKQVRLADQQVADVALARERIMREARIAAALHHPHIVSIFDVVLEDGEPWLVLEFLPSRSMGSVLAERGTLPAVEVAAIGADVAAALAAAHAAGIVHRDVKPDNVLLSRPSAAGPLVKLTDFGIAHTAAAPALTATHVLTGTPAYFAPETARGEGTDSRSDVYSLGATLYAAVEGHPPFGTDPGNVLALLARIGRGGAPVPQRAGPLTDLLGSLTDDDPAARPTAAQAHAVLRRIADSGRPAATVVSPPIDPVRVGVQELDPVALPRREQRPRRGSRVAAAIAAAITVVAGLITAVVVTLPDGAPGGAGPSVPPAVTPPTETAGTAVIADVTTADPCSLVDLAALHPFGTASLDLRDDPFAGCSVKLERSDGSTATYALTFQNGLEIAQVTGGRREQEAGYTVISYDPVERYCDQHILLADGNAIQLAVWSQDGWTGSADMCEVTDAARAAVLARLAAQGIGVRAPAATSPLTGIPSCSLLTAEDLSVAIPNATPPRPRFADWGCDWASFTSTERVTLIYYRTLPLGAYLGTPTDIAGHPGLVLPQGGSCWVPFVQRSYTVAGSDGVEAVWLTYEGPGTDAELCQAATALATAAARRLPPPS